MSKFNDAQTSIEYRGRDVSISVADGMLEGDRVKLVPRWNVAFHLHGSISAQWCNCLSSEAKYSERNTVGGWGSTLTQMLTYSSILTPPSRRAKEPQTISSQHGCGHLSINVSCRHRGRSHYARMPLIITLCSDGPCLFRTPKGRSVFVTAAIRYPAHCLPPATIETADMAIGAQVRPTGAPAPPPHHHSNSREGESKVDGNWVNGQRGWRQAYAWTVQLIWAQISQEWCERVLVTFTLIVCSERDPRASAIIHHPFHFLFFMAAGYWLFGSHRLETQGNLLIFVSGHKLVLFFCIRDILGDSFFPLYFCYYIREAKIRKTI